jgi:hypothetical protein
MTTNLKAGIDTNSLNNHLFSRMRGEPIPEVGMGATRLQWTDRTACTIIAVERSGSSIVLTVQDDIATRADDNGMSDAQSYTYERNPDGRTKTYRSTKDGGWRECRRNENGRWVWADREMLLVGTRRQYHDFSF